MTQPNLDEAEVSDRKREEAISNMLRAMFPIALSMEDYADEDSMMTQCADVSIPRRVVSAAVDAYRELSERQGEKLRRDIAELEAVSLAIIQADRQRSGYAPWQCATYEVYPLAKAALRASAQYRQGKGG